MSRIARIKRISKYILRQKLLGIPIFLTFILACSGSGIAEKKIDRVPLGFLTNIQSVELFSDKSLSQSLTSESPVALMLSTVSIYQLLLPDGRIAWTKELKANLSTEIKIFSHSSTISVSTLPFTKVGEPGFEWTELESKVQLKLKAVTQEYYIQTPDFILKQGRSLSSGSHFLWPQLHVEVGAKSGWASVSDLHFEYPPYVVNNARLPLYGLIQRPFLNLINGKYQKTLAVGAPYLDFTGQKSSIGYLPNTEWEVWQVILPTTPAGKTWQSITLFSGKDNCTIFAVAWKEKNRYFGYCQGYESPTPVIIDYSFVPSTGEILLYVVDVLGDEEIQRTYSIINNSKGIQVKNITLNN